MSRHNFIHWLLTAIKIFVSSIFLGGVGIAVAMTGYIIFIEGHSPLNLLIGFPVMLFGICMGLINFYAAFQSVVDKEYNRHHCPICNP